MAHGISLYFITSLPLLEGFDAILTVVVLYNTEYVRECDATGVMDEEKVMPTVTHRLVPMVRFVDSYVTLTIILYVTCYTHKWFESPLHVACIMHSDFLLATFIP